MLNTIPEALNDLKIGKIIIVVDDENRENEGDFICAAEYATAENINLMATIGKGLICMPMSKEYAQKLSLPPMTYENTDNHSTAFAISIDHINTTTGISAYDRSLTALKAVDENVKPSDFRRPGHMFPLIAEDGGVLVRNGHTEATVDLMRLANLKEVGICCEIMNDNGTMAGRDDLIKLAQKLDLKIISIKALQQYIKKNERLMEVLIKTPMPTEIGNFEIIGFTNKLDQKEHIAIIKGNISDKENVLIRIHSECFTGDILGSLRCDCGSQLKTAMQRIEKEGCGIILYLRQEGRGIGLLNKLKAYKLQDQNIDTVDANLALGFQADERDYAVAAQMLKTLGVRSVRIMTNNPEKIQGLEQYGIIVNHRESIETGLTEKNLKYMQTKKNKMKHIINKIN